MLAEQVLALGAQQAHRMLVGPTGGARQHEKVCTAEMRMRRLNRLTLAGERPAKQLGVPVNSCGVFVILRLQPVVHFIDERLLCVISHLVWTVMSPASRTPGISFSSLSGSLPAVLVLAILACPASSSIIILGDTLAHITSAMIAASPACPYAS